MTTNYQQERRKQRAFERLGTTTPRCVVCGEADWRCLESHHIQGEDYGDDRAILCGNCHRKERDCQIDHPGQLSEGEPSILEKIGHFLLGLADLLAMLVERMREYGHVLIEAARYCPAPYGIVQGEPG